jgi:hypothetical protein
VVSGDDRGQLLLVAAIVVATAVLGGVVLLNTVHSSPDLSAQTDAQSVTNTDRTVSQMENDLRGLFMANGVDENGTRLPYANSTFEDAVDAYSNEYTRLMSTNQSAVATVELNTSESNNGIVAYANQSSAAFVDDGNNFVVTDAAELPRLRLRIDQIGSSETLRVKINDSSTDVEFTFNESNGVDGDIQCSNADTTPVEIDLVHGAGEVTGDGAYCTVAVDESDWNALTEYNVKFEYGPNTNGTYAVAGSGINADCTDSDWCETGIVNPGFDLTYQNPNVAYSSTFRLYERDDR